MEIKSSVNADFYICSILLKNVIPDVLVDLDVPSCLSNMMFQPGDAYDENLIQEAKNIGKSLFLDLNWPERKIKINSQVLFEFFHSVEIKSFKVRSIILYNFFLK